MELLFNLYNIVKEKLPEITDAIAYLCLFASIIIKLTPTLKDDNYFKPLIKIIGKYIALDKYSPPKLP